MDATEEHSRSGQWPSLAAELGGLCGGRRVRRWERDLPGGASTEVLASEGRQLLDALSVHMSRTAASSHRLHHSIL